MIAAPKRILVINVTRIGDTLLTTPVLRALAVHWPDAAIDFAGHPKRVEVMQGLPFLRHIRPITKYRARFMGYFGGTEYELGLVFGNDRPLIEYALRVADKVIAFQQSQPDLNLRLYAIAGDEASRPAHAVPYLLQMLTPLGVPPAGQALAYAVQPDELSWADSIVNQEAGNHRPLIGLQVASFPTKAFRDWPLEHFEALCTRVLEKYPSAHFFIFGGGEEKSRTTQLHQKFADHASLFAGRLTLRQTAALMNKLDAYVGVDTGPTHIMGALHRPMVALYHATSPSSALGPLEHPCFFPVDHPRANQNPSTETPMAEIGVEVVFGRLVEALARGGNK